MTQKDKKAEQKNTELTLGHSMLRGALRLSFFVVLGVLLLVGVNELTSPKIEEAKKRSLLEIINQVMPEDNYNNDLLEDIYPLTDATPLPTGQILNIYRARLDSQPQGLVISATTPKGYSGNIDLIIGVNSQGQVLGVRTLSHTETPGLGDKIELQKDKWILGFNNRLLTQDNAHLWAVKRDRGEFDQFTGATITPRAVINLVREVLEYTNQMGDELYDN